MPRTSLEEDKYYLEENSGKTFAIKNIINRLYKGFEVDYMGEDQENDFQITIDF